MEPQCHNAICNNAIHNASNVEADGKHLFDVINVTNGAMPKFQSAISLHGLCGKVQLPAEGLESGESWRAALVFGTRLS